MARAFLIGAGATRAQYDKAPLSADFFKILRGCDKATYAAMANAVNIHLGVSLSEANVEDVMDKSYEFPVSIQTSFLESLHLAIYLVLADATQSLPVQIEEYVRGEGLRPPTLFKTLLNDPRLHNDDFFMTLNDDLYLDSEIWSVQEGQIDYGIRPEFIGPRVDPGLLPRPDFSVYHLHGSLNWEFVDQTKVNIYMGAYYPSYGRTGPKLCLVPPGRKELYPVLNSIWGTARERLLKADELIIIGCSLNPKDTGLIDMMGTFVHEVGIEKIKIVYWAESNLFDEEERHYRQVIGSGFKGYRYGFNLNAPPVEHFQPKIPGAIEFIFS